MVVCLRHEGKSETSTDIFWAMAAAALVLSPALLLAGPGAPLTKVPYDTLGVALPVMLWAIGLGAVSTGFAYFGISIVLKSLNANIYALVDIIVSPVVASTLGFLVFAEVPPQNMIYGGAMLLAAGFWLTHEMSRGAENRAVHPCQCA